MEIQLSSPHCCCFHPVFESRMFWVLFVFDKGIYQSGDGKLLQYTQKGP